MMMQTVGCAHDVTATNVPGIVTRGNYRAVSNLHPKAKNEFIPALEPRKLILALPVAVLEFAFASIRFQG